MRCLLLAPALLLAAPAVAQQADPSWVGVWEGRVGRFPVRLCLDSWGDDVPGRGSYYYLSQLEPISLSDAGDTMWIERAPGSDKEAEWFFEQVIGDAARGLWRQGSRELRFELKRVPWSEGDWGGACSSAAYIDPRLSGGDVAEKPATLDGWEYAEHSFKPPAHLLEDVTVVTFTYPESRPGDAAINAALGTHLPRGGIGDDVYDCMAGAISSLGVDGFFELAVAPAMVSPEFIATEETSGSFCGGAHPNYYTVAHTYDRRSGEELDLFDWLGEPRSDGEDRLAEGLRELIVARWPADAEADCRDLAVDADYWSLGLARDGLVFRPDFPHVATACEEAITVEWDALAPFLDSDGRAGLARLRGG